MSRLLRLTFGASLVAAVAAGLVAFADPAMAQFGGFGKGFDKGKGFERGKEFDRDRGNERPRGESKPTDVVKNLEAELAKVKEQEAALEAKLKRAKEAAARAATPPADPFRGGGGFGGFGGPGGGFGGPPIDRMSPEQIKEMIVQLQKALEEKTKVPPTPRGGGSTGGGGRPAPVPQDEIMKRLDQLSREMDELRRTVRERR